MNTIEHYGDKLRRARVFLREHRKAVVRYLSIAVVILLSAWTWLYLRPSTWACYTDEIELSCTSRSVEPQYVMWDDAKGIDGLLGEDAGEPSFSPDGTMMAFSRKGKDGSDLFTAVWDGTSWKEPVPMRAVNSQFNERTPRFSRDGKIIYFSTDRPGGPGGTDIWVARWDGSEFAWPVPLTSMVNSPYDELSPAQSAAGDQLFFSSNRPRRNEIKEEEDVEFIIEDGPDGKVSDFDIFSANVIPEGVTNREVERATSMLYYLRESALSDPAVMMKLGGSRDSEKAIDRALEFLAKKQHADGHWTVPAKGDRHNVAVTSLSLLSFLGRGCRHDRPGKYQDTVNRGLTWLLAQQKMLGSVEGRGDFYDHAMATLALGEAYGLTKDEDLFDAAHTAIDFIVESQNEDGGWRYRKGDAPSDLSVSGWMIMALKNAELSGLYVPEEAFEGIRRFLEMVAGGENGGFFGYQDKKSGSGQPAMRATGYFCSQLMGLSPNTLRSFEAADIMETRGAAADDFYYMYYGTLAANQHQGPIWREWRTKLPKLLLPVQNKDGSWVAVGPHAQDMGQIVGTSLATLSLQAHYRYTPMYGLGYEPDISKSRLAALTRDDLPDVPLYRLAKRRHRLSSRKDDIDPFATKHGDFLYFASDRWGGNGGLDIYRSRISGEKPTKPENVGPGVNSRSDETAPATRMAGFNLVFASSRGDKPSLYSSTSRRVRIEYDLSNRPSFVWFLKTFVWHLLLAASAAAVFMYWLRVWRHRMKPLVFRADISRSMQAITVSRRWLVPVLSSLVLLGCLLSMRSILYRTAWCFYTDDQGLRRNALVDTVRPVLWSTHLTYGPINKPMSDTTPQFSPDGTQVFLSEARDGETEVTSSTWDGVRWEEGRPDDLPEEEVDEPGTGGGYRFFSKKSGWLGGRDLYMGREADESDSINLGRLVNSKLDDAVPAVRMEGFDLMFASNRSTKDKGRYLLYTSTAREVLSRMNYARWHSFVGMLNRIKWWVFALVAAVLGLCYLLRHMKDMTSLFHKCLLGSVAAHLVILLLMAGWIISAEFIESVESTTMEISLDVNALAQEKLALELETDLTELTDISDTTKVEKSQNAQDIPMLNQEVVEDVPDIVAELPEHAFIEDVKAASTEDSTKDQINSKALDPLANVEMAMLKVKPALEEPRVKDVSEKREVEDPVVEQAFELERREVEKVQAEAEEEESQVPEFARAKLDRAVHELSAQLGEAKPLPEESIEVAVMGPMKDVPEFKPVKVELEAAGSTSVEKEDEFKPATVPKQLEIDRLEEQKVETVAVGGLVDPANVTGSADTNSMTSAVIGEFAPESREETVSQNAPARLMPEQLIADVLGSVIRAQMEVVNIPAPSRESRASAGKDSFVPDTLASETGPSSFEPAVSQAGAQIAKTDSVAPMRGIAALPLSMDVELSPDAPAAKGGISLSELQVTASKTREKGIDIPSFEIASAKPALRIGVDLPGKLSIPVGYNRTAVPEIMKNPSKLSDEVITGLGGSGETQASIARALDWFSKNQAKDGRWSLSNYGGNSAHDVGGTSLVLLCFYGWGAKHTQEGEYQDTVKTSVDWLVSQMLENGDMRGWSRHRYEEDELLGNMYDHTIATIALCEAYGLTKDKELLEPCRKAVAFLVAAQEQKLGGWRYDPNEDSDTSVLGWAYMALKSAELAGIDLPKETFSRADTWLKGVSGGKFGGIYGYQKPEKKREAMVATGMFCRQLGGVPANDPGMHEGMGYIATHPLSAEELDYYYMYYGTLVMYQNQGPIWEEWNERMKEIVLAAQHKSGSKRGTWDPEKWYGFQMGRVVSTAISTLSLEVYYRILPIYGFGVQPTINDE